MLEWLTDSFEQDPTITFGLVATRLLVSLAFGCSVAAIYRATRRPSVRETISLVPTLVLLTIIIAMVTLSIGNSAARAFALVGSLAIVRFRTVVDDARDTAFVILAVAVGLSAGAGFLLVPLVGIPIAGLAAFVFRPRDEVESTKASCAELTVRVGVGHAPATLFRETFAQHLQSSRIHSSATAKQGAALELCYRVELKSDDSAVELVSALNRLEGVQAVDLRMR